jgi:DNA modification methylase
MPLKIEEWDIDRLIPYSRNPRRNDAAVPKMAGLIREFGFKVPIVARSDGSVIDGHLRLKAAQALGMEKVPVVLADEWTPAQVKAFRLAVNRSAEWAEWDEELLKLELEELKLEDYDLDLIGFDDVLLDADGTEGLTDPDDVPEVQEVPLTKEGDIWLLGKHRLMCGDSTDLGSVALLMNGEKASMVFTDPPWNVDYGNAKKINPQGWKVRSILNDHMSTEDFKDFMDRTFKAMKDAVIPGAMIYVVMSAQEWGNLMLVLKDNEFHWSSTIIWSKDRLVLGRKDYQTRYEPIWYGWDGRSSRIHPLEDRTQSDVWDIPRPSSSEEHPTMKPVELVERAIANSSNGGDLVLDLFGGSGTTMIASEKIGRRSCLMELDPKYCDVIVRRWQEFTGHEATLESDGRTFSEVESETKG